MQNSGKQRHLLVLSGDPDWCREQASALLRNLPGACWVGGRPHKGFGGQSLARAANILGQETDALVVDACENFDPDALAAAAGTLRGSGSLLLLTPPLDSWPSQPQGLLDGQAGGYFIDRLIALLRATPQVTWVYQNDTHPTQPSPAPPVGDKEQDHPEQIQAVLALIRVVEGHRRRPLVLLADRGRGKSAALGMAAAQLIRRGRQRILLTAPSLESTRAALRHAALMLPQAHLSNGRLRLDRALLEFVPPDALCRDIRPADLLLVDEAAAIPPAILEKLLAAYPRIAFASTVHGYEGTGRGFALRFRAHLDRQTPQWREMRLQQPIRWAADDWLEPLIFDALLLDAEAAPRSLLGETSGEEQLIAIPRQRLAEDESLLRGLFGLMVSAHYRTRPRDLWRLLDDPDMRIFALLRSGHVAAAVLTSDEAGLDEDLAGQILKGKRRLRGRLLQQSLIQHMGLIEAHPMRCRRIVRIAVHPDLQGKGLGSRMLQQLAQISATEGAKLLGASFGADSPLLSFWRRNGFHPVRLGASRETSSGAHSALLLLALDEQADKLLNAARRRFRRHFPVMLSDTLREMEPEMALVLLASLPPCPAVSLDPADQRDLEAIAHAHRDYEVSPGMVAEVLLRAFSGSEHTCLSKEEKIVLLSRAIQNRSWKQSAELAQLSGKKAAVSTFRLGLARILEQQTRLREF